MLEQCELKMKRQRLIVYYMYRVFQKNVAPLKLFVIFLLRLSLFA